VVDSQIAGAGVATDSRIIPPVKTLAVFAATVAFWLFGSDSTTYAGCGDYLVGVAQTQQSADSMTPDHSRGHSPSCESSNEPIAPPIPVFHGERIPVDPAYYENDFVPMLETCGWSDAEPTPARSIASETLDRPPKT
jgi:hypothetical protein